MEKQALPCPTCKTPIEKWWASAINPAVKLGYCPNCKRKVNLGKAESNLEGTGSEGGTGKAGTPAKAQSKKTARRRGKAKAVASARPGTGSGRATIPPEQRQPETGRIGRLIREFFIG
jgi:hypothetical protein